MERDGSSTSASFHGFIADQYDAALLVTAARLGFIPRFRRRLDLIEQRALIHSGSVFLWNEEESYMKRWTDGYPWSPSRVQNKFLVYREMTKRGGARSRTAARLLGHTPESSADSSRRKYIRNLASSLFNKGELEFLELYSNSGYPRCDDIFKRGGLVKKTYTITLPKETWHVVAYYTLEDILSDRLTPPSESPSLCHPRIYSEVTAVLENSSRAPFETTILRLQTPSPLWTTPLLDSRAHTDQDLDSSVIQDQAPPQATLPAAPAAAPANEHTHIHTVDISIIPDPIHLHYSPCYPVINDSNLTSYSLPPSPVVFTSQSPSSSSSDYSDYVDENIYIQQNTYLIERSYSTYW